MNVFPSHQILYMLRKACVSIFLVILLTISLSPAALALTNGKAIKDTDENVNIENAEVFNILGENSDLSNTEKERVICREKAYGSETEKGYFDTRCHVNKETMSGIQQVIQSLAENEKLVILLAYADEKEQEVLDKVNVIDEVRSTPFGFGKGLQVCLQRDNKDLSICQTGGKTVLEELETTKKTEAEYLKNLMNTKGFQHECDFFVFNFVGLGNIQTRNCKTSTENTDSSSSSNNNDGIKNKNTAVYLQVPLPGEEGNFIQDSGGTYLYTWVIKARPFLVPTIILLIIGRFVIIAVKISLAGFKPDWAAVGKKEAPMLIVSLFVLLNLGFLPIFNSFFTFEGQINAIQDAEIADSNTEGDCINDTALVTFPIRTFNGSSSSHSFKIRSDLVEEVEEIFTKIYEAGFPVSKDFTGGFVCRKARESNKISPHGLGIAIDLNWNINPYFKLKDEYSGYDGYPGASGTKTFTSTAESIRTFRKAGSEDIVLTNENWRDYVRESSIKPGPKSEYDFTGQKAGTIHPNNPTGKIVIEAFKEAGWGWGGDWSSLKDYMHFSKSGY